MAILVRAGAKALELWRPLLTAALPGRDLHFFPELGDPVAIDIALVWQPEPGLLSGLPSLKLIVCLGAGVDAIIGDPTFPRHLPVVRLVDPYMTAAMSEYIVFQVLRLHRQDLTYAAQQRAAEWREHPQKNAAERPVGILGFGTLGQDAGRKLKALGFDVAGWSRTAKDVPGIGTYAGVAGLDAILARSEILVSLLPATRDTQDLLDASAFVRLPRGAAVVNAGRGKTVVEADLLAALDSGQLSAAILDVFETEPLPPGHSFWHHPRIVVTPHIAADTHPATAIGAVVQAIREFEAGLPLTNRVDLDRGY
ncbi:MAG TPA: glyoxylate/hydroxypyruvate reductase A [Stellaceae bacterium]|jgi:glyoxylate/hydroxypyruvate reductase A